MTASSAPCAATAGAVFAAIRSGAATSRADLAKHLGVAASTVSLRVADLVAAGLVHETRGAAPAAGRPVRELAVEGSAGWVAAVEVGASHARLALVDLAGNVVTEAGTRDGSLGAPSAAADGAAVVDEIWGLIAALARRHRLAVGRLKGLAVSVPAPVVQPSGTLQAPAFMPAWHGLALADEFARHTSATVLVENDANLVALGEATLNPAQAAGGILALKCGTRLGSGIVLGGHLHRGHTGAAGEFAHTQVAGNAAVPCSCSVANCLEAVASGGAIAARLRAGGLDVADAAAVVAAEPLAGAMVSPVIREAGTRIGEVVATFVNFFNPAVVALAGTMAQSPTLVAALRAEVYQRALPVAAESLDIRTSTDPQNVEILGAGRLILDHVLSPGAVDAALVGEA
jgi:predicted NBD/HSP70 family sugar kinase